MFRHKSLPLNILLWVEWKKKPLDLHLYGYVCGMFLISVFLFVYVLPACELVYAADTFLSCIYSKRRDNIASIFVEGFIIMLLFIIIFFL